MTDSTRNLAGLSSARARQLQEQYGKNELTSQKRESFLKKVVHIICEPMFLLLIVAAIIYFILGEPRDGAVMLIFVVGIIGIDIMQEWKTDQTLNALKDLSAPQIRVVRDGAEQTIASENLVPGDIMLIYEGVKITADGIIVKCNDLRINESSLTGEAEEVWKVQEQDAVGGMNYWRKDYCYAGTLVTQGTGVVLVDKIGVETEYGKIGINVAEAPEEDTPLQKQTRGLVRLCAGIAAILFVLVGIFTYFNIPDHLLWDRLIESVLSGVTLAMAMIPEEFPVVLTVFLSMGAWRLAKKNSLVRRLPSVETLGAVSILCVDKTGTITMNEMTVQELYSISEDRELLCKVMGLGCETDAYDPMEKAMLSYCDSIGIHKEDLFSGELLREYPFTNESKMMGHIWRRNGEIIIAVKGSPEQILTLCEMSEAKQESVLSEINRMSKEGLRVIAVAMQELQEETQIPEVITACRLTFCGLVGLADPPRECIRADIESCNRAGIRVVMITGDNGITASSIAKRVGMENCDHSITGDRLNEMSDEELRESVLTTNIFSRVIPEHKMRIVKAFQENGEIVAMTGDGVNDAPALKYADIGIAMGHRGSEVAREAADLILLDDNFTTIVETIKDGRRIYDNIRKAIGYIITIHMPIAFASLLAPILGINPAALLLLPLHVVLLELLIDPTCSIVLERQPAEKEIMQRSPRNPKERMVTNRMLLKSMIQGIIIFAASFGIYYHVWNNGISQPQIARSMGLIVIMMSNLFLVQVNSSDLDYAFHSVKNLSHDKVMWAANFGTLAMIAVILYSPLNSFLKLAPISAFQLVISVCIAFAAVFWYEGVKYIKNWKRN